MIVTVTVDDGTKADGELASLVENFRDQATTLVDMLDVSIPMVAKLKVKIFSLVVIVHLL